MAQLTVTLEDVVALSWGEDGARGGDWRVVMATEGRDWSERPMELLAITLQCEKKG